MKNKDLRTFILFLIILFIVSNSTPGITQSNQPIDWATETVDSNLSAGYYSSLAFDSQDNPHISYYVWNGGLRYAKRSGTSWTKSDIEPSQYSGRYSSLVLDSNDNPHVSYYDSSNYGRVKYAYLNAGTWQTQIVGSGSESGTSIAVDHLNVPHISFSSNGPLVYASLNSGTWIIETVDTSGGYSSLKFDDSNNPHISYFSNNRLKHAYKDASGWHIQDIDYARQMYTSLALDKNNYPHISYSYQTSLRYAYWDGLAWKTQTVVSDSWMVAQNASIALDQEDFPHIAHSRSSDYALVYAYKDSGGWHVQDGMFGVGTHVSLALDSRDYPHVSFSNEQSSKGLVFVYPSPPPQSSFSLTQTKAWTNKPISFTTTTTVYGKIVNYIWEFGDGQSSTLPNPSHAYSTPGTYTVKLTASNNSGSTSSTKVIQIFDVSFSSSTPDWSGQTTTFTNQSNVEESTTFSWNFGDGTNSSLESPFHEYITPGVFPVSLTASNPTIGSKTFSNNVIVYGPPDTRFSASPLTGNSPLWVSFSNLTTTYPLGDNSISYVWDFGDGSSSTEANVSHIFNNPGSYNVKLTAKNDAGERQYILPNSVFVKSIYKDFLPLLIKPLPPTPTPSRTPTRAPTQPYKTATPSPSTSVTCYVSPSTVSGASNTPLTFYAIFSPAGSGYGFDVSFSQSYSGQRQCSGADGGDGVIDGIASCTGSSGMLPYGGKTVTVTFNSSVGKCYATYKSR